MKVWALKIGNVLLYLVTCVLAGTGFLLEFRLEDDGARILKLSSDDWAEIHLVLAFVFLALSVAHLLLNWNWVTGLFRRKNRLAMIVTGLVGAVLVVVIMLVPASNPSGPKGNHQGQSHVTEDD